MQPILPSQPSHFFLHPAAVTFAFNALGDPDNIGISVYSNAQVILFVRDIDGLDQLPDNNYRSWTLSAYPTHFTDAEGCARYCHIAFSRTTNQATLVFPDTRLDLLGRAITDDGQSFLAADDAHSSEEYYFAFIGKITASGPASSKQPRQWANIAAYPITGNLKTDYYTEYEQKGDLDKMFRYSSQYGNDGAILQLLPITVSRIWKLLIGTAEKAITDIFRLSDRAAEDLPSISRGSTEDTAPTITAPLDEVIPTEAHMRDYTDQNFLSKKKGGVVEADVTFTKDVAVHGDSTVGGDQEIAGDLTTHGNAAFGSNAGSQSFATGLMGNGWRFDEQGHGEADSLSLRKFLEVPELRYNKISVRTGVQWQTFGAGLIEEVLHPEGLAANEGVIKLKLEDGEYGAVAADDLCMGIYHNEGDGKGNNATHTSDDHNGNFAFQGFTTIYFRIVGICDANGSLSLPDSRNQYFRYELRPDWKTGGFDQTSTHPQPSMTFACYANPSNAERQSSVYSSTDYLIMLSGMVDWTYDSSNITYIRGRLAGFTINTTKGDMALEGYGIAIGKEYRWGTEIVFDRPAQLINQQLYLAISDKQPDEFKASLSSVVWTDESISPTKEKPYKYGYWKKTYILDGDEVISPKNNQPTAADVSLQGTYAESGESAISIVYEPSNLVVVDVSMGAWNEEGEGVTAEVAADSYHRVTVKMMYGQQVESIANIVVGTVKGIVDAQVEIAADKKSAVIAFGVTKELPINQTTYLPLTFHSIHTTVGYRNDLVITTSVAGNDGQDGQQGVGIASYNEQYYANDGSQIPDSTVGFVTPTMAGFSAEHPCLWNKTTIINTLNEVVNNPRWDVISWWGRDGQDTYRQYSVDGENDWHNTYTDGDIYERVSTDGVEWSKPFRIVGENGAAGPYTDYSFALSVWAENNDATQCPPDLVNAEWNDNPIKPTPECPYLWQRSIRYSLAGNTLVPDAPCYVRINGKDGVIGQHGISTFTTYNGQKERPAARPTGNGEGNGWHRNPDDCGTPIWASQKQAVNVEDGEWSAPYKCSATDGQSVNIKDTLPNAAAIFAIENPEVNDAYIAEDTGVVYVWNGVNWVNCGKFRGEDGRDGVDGYDGVSSYLHLKYSDDGLSFTAPDGTYAKGERPAAWMGTLVDTNEEDPVADADFNRYKWVHIQGMPATTYEIITSAYVIAKDTNGNAKEGITMDFYKVTGEQREKADCYVAVSKDGVETIARYNKTPLVLTATELSSINTLNVEMRITADGEAVDHISLSTIKDGENGNSIHIKGHKATAAELASVDNPQINDAWVVDENGCLYVYTATGWDNVGKFSGKDGEDGKDGQNVVVYVIVPSCSILSMSTDGEAADGIEFAFYKYEGSLTRVPQPMYYNIKVKYTDGHIYEETKETADPSVTIPSQKLDNCEWVLCEVWVNKADKGESTKRDAYETIYTVTDGTIPSWDELTDDQKNDLRGEDGSSSEFIYLLSDTYPFDSSLAPANPAPTDRYVDEFVPDGWTDDPSPVSETMRYQYVAVRYKNVKKNNDRKRYWSDWSAVSLWNRYAEDGKDGNDAVLYSLDHISSFLMRKVSGQYVFVEDIYHFTFFKTVGNQPRETLNGNYRVKFEFLNANRASLAAPYVTTIPSTGKVEFDVSSDWFDDPQYDPSIDYYQLLADSMQYLVLSLLDSNGNVLATSDMNRVNEGEQGPQGPRGDRGDTGLQGCVVRPRGEWQDGVTYVNESATEKQIRYIDVVTGKDSQGIPVCFARKGNDYPTDRNGQTIFVKPKDTRVWKKQGSYYVESDISDYDIDWQYIWDEETKASFVATEVLLADNAYIQFASGQASFYLDKQNKIRAGIQGETTTEPMIFAGSSYKPNEDFGADNIPANAAPFRVYKDGTLIAANVNNQFQDVSGFTSVDEDGMEWNAGWVYLETIRYGQLLSNGNVTKHAQARVYNLRCDDTTILLPTSEEYIGQRVILYNGISDPSKISSGGLEGSNDESTRVVQEGNKTFLGVGIVERVAGKDWNNNPIWKLDGYTEVSKIAFMAGVMEFIAVPDGNGCRWAVINDGVTAKWFDGNFIM